MLVGAIAVAYHGYPRYSQDLDFFVSPDRQNVKKLFTALDDFFGGSFDSELSYEDIHEGSTIRFGSGEHTTDFLSKIDGVEFEKAYQNRERLEYEEGKFVPIIGVDELIENKESTDRTKDKADAEELRKIQKS